jgi:hypothetical protein
MMIDQRACVNTVDITQDLDGNIDGSDNSSTSTTYYVYVTDDDVAAGTFSMSFRTSNADNFSGERMIGSVTTDSSGSPPDVIGITDDDAATATEQKLLKAWINFNGTGTIAINDSFNITSIADNNIGDYTITFDVDFADTNFAWSANSISNSTGPNNMRVLMVQSGAKAAGSVDIINMSDGNTEVDEEDINFMATGDQ